MARAVFEGSAGAPIGDKAPGPFSAAFLYGSVVVFRHVLDRFGDVLPTSPGSLLGPCGLKKDSRNHSQMGRQVAASTQALAPPGPCFYSLSLCVFDVFSARAVFEGSPGVQNGRKSGSI